MYISLSLCLSLSLSLSLSIYIYIYIYIYIIYTPTPPRRPVAPCPWRLQGFMKHMASTLHFLMEPQ